MSAQLRELLVHMGLLDPTTGLVRTVGGRPLIAGGSVNDPGDGESGESEPEGEPEGEPGGEPEGEPEGEDEPDDDKDKGKTQRTPDAERRKREEDERARKTRNRIAAAERRASDAESKARRLQAEVDKDKPEVERLRGELVDAEANVSRLTGVNRDLALQVAFFRNSRVDWVDPGDAMTIALRELSDLEVDDDGAVDDEQVRQVITRMAKDKPHLVRRSQPKSGDRVGAGSRKDGQQSADAARIASMFPAVRSRNVGVGPAPPSQQ